MPSKVSTHLPATEPTTVRGCSRVRIPLAIALAATLVAGTEVGPVVVCSVTVRSRPDDVGTPEASTILAGTSSFDCTVRAPSRIGPQRW